MFFWDPRLAAVTSHFILGCKPSRTALASFVHSRLPNCSPSCCSADWRAPEASRSIGPGPVENQRGLCVTSCQAGEHLQLPIQHSQSPLRMLTGAVASFPTLHLHDWPSSFMIWRLCRVRTPHSTMASVLPCRLLGCFLDPVANGVQEPLAPQACACGIHRR